MAILNNNNRYRKMRFVVYEDKIVLGPQRKYSLKGLQTLAVLIMIFSFAMLAVVGAGLIVKESLVQTMLLLVCLIVFIYGTQLTGICRSGKEIILQRNKEIEKANNYVRKEKKNG